MNKTNILLIILIAAVICVGAGYCITNMNKEKIVVVNKTANNTNNTTINNTVEHTNSKNTNNTQSNSNNNNQANNNQQNKQQSQSKTKDKEVVATVVYNKEGEPVQQADGRWEMTDEGRANGYTVSYWYG